jgi:hypothetical protein
MAKVHLEHFGGKPPVRVPHGWHSLEDIHEGEEALRDGFECSERVKALIDEVDPSRNRIQMRTPWCHTFKSTIITAPSIRLIDEQTSERVAQITQNYHGHTVALFSHLRGAAARLRTDDERMTVKQGEILAAEAAAETLPEGTPAIAQIMHYLKKMYGDALHVTSDYNTAGIPLPLFAEVNTGKLGIDVPLMRIEENPDSSLGQKLMISELANPELINEMKKHLNSIEWDSPSNRLHTAI